MTIINEHMTWEQIVEKYPDKWVGLTDIVWENESNVESAVLFAVSTNAEEVMSMQIDKKVQFVDYTTPDNCFQLGFIVGV